MNGTTIGRVVARLVKSSTAFNTLNLPPPIPIHFQRSPDFPQGDVRGIQGMDFQVVSGGAVIQVGTTPADGRITGWKFYSPITVQYGRRCGIRGHRRSRRPGSSKQNQGSAATTSHARLSNRSRRDRWRWRGWKSKPRLRALGSGLSDGSGAIGGCGEPTDTTSPHRKSWSVKLGDSRKGSKQSSNHRADSLRASGNRRRGHRRAGCGRSWVRDGKPARYMGQHRHAREYGHHDRRRYRTGRSLARGHR